MEIEGTELQVLMWLVRFQLRRYRRNRQFEDLLGAAYAGMWRSLLTLAAGEAGEGERAKRAAVGAHWGALDWLRSAANESRVLRRSHSRLVPLPRRLSWEEWEERRHEQERVGAPVAGR